MSGGYKCYPPGGERSLKYLSCILGTISRRGKRGEVKEGREDKGMESSCYGFGSFHVPVEVIGRRRACSSVRFVGGGEVNPHTGRTTPLLTVKFDLGVRFYPLRKV